MLSEWLPLLAKIDETPLREVKERAAGGLHSGSSWKLYLGLGLLGVFILGGFTYMYYREWKMKRDFDRYRKRKPPTANPPAGKQP